MSTYAYIHLHPKNPTTLAAFKETLREFHLRPENLLVDEGEKRYYYKLLLAKLKAGDLVIIDSLSSFGRREAQIIEMWEELRNKHHVNIKVMSQECLDTRRKAGDGADTPAADAAMQIIRGILEEMKEMRKKKSAR